MCDGCGLRQTACVAQEHTPDVAHKHEPVRDRVAQLEETVRGLVHSVTRLEASAGLDASAKASVGADHGASPQDSDSDIPGNVPAHLKSLFENDVLLSKESAETETAASDQKNHEAKMDRIRHQLIQLTPTLEEATYVVKSSSDWWSTFNVLFPPISISGKDGLLAEFDHLKDPSLPPSTIAMWLICWSLTVLQADPSLGTSRLHILNRPSEYASRVVGLVEHLVISNHGLMATLEGLECASMFVRL